MQGFTQRPAVAIVLFVIGMSLIPLNDSFVRMMSEGMPTGQFISFRSVIVIGLALMLPSTLRQLLTLTRSQLLLLSVRGVVMGMALLLLFISVVLIPLSTAYGIFFTSPAMITLAGFFLFGERPTAFKIASIFLGFGGAILILEPWISGEGQQGFDWLAVSLSFAAACFYTIHQLITRSFGTSVDPTAALCLQQTWMGITSILATIVVVLGYPLLASLFGPAEAASVDFGRLDFLAQDWILPDWSQRLILLGCAMIAGFMLWAGTNVYFVVPASVAAVFEYASLPASVFWGFLIFRDPVSWFDPLGIVCITLGGLLVAFGERRSKG